MKFLSLILVLFFLSSCAVTDSSYYEYRCFDSESKAREIGRKIADAGFFNRVSYWVTGDSENSIPGLGLKWAGFEPSKYCLDDGYPIVVTFDSEKSEYDSETVMRWSRSVLSAMIKDVENET